MPSIINATTTNGVAISPDNSGSLQLATNNGTTAVTIDTSQNVGIGTTAPSVKLTVSGGLAIQGTSANLPTSGQGWEITPESSTAAAIQAYNRTGSAWLDGKLYAGNWIFLTNGSERMRIDSNGNISVTQTAGRYTCDVNGGATTLANGGTVDFSNASGMLVVNSHTTGALTIYIMGAGNTGAVASVVGQVGTMTYVAGINGYRFTNNSGVTATFGFFFVRTRANA